MATTEEKMLKELEEISFLLGDLNHIRNGEYEPPKGASLDRTQVRATPDDIYNTLCSVVSLLERQNTMIYNLGRVFCEAQEFSDDYWNDLNRDA
ncbi:hypothetical protein [Mycolicibacterium lutetiense]